MSSSLPYSVVVSQYKVLPFLNVVGDLQVGNDLDVSGDLVVDGKTFLNGSLDVTALTTTTRIQMSGALGCGAGPSSGSSGNGLASRGAATSPEWIAGSLIFPQAIFQGTLTAVQATVNAAYVDMIGLTTNVINVGGTILDTATGVATIITAGYYHFYHRTRVLYAANDGTNTAVHMDVKNGATVVSNQLAAFNIPTGTFGMVTLNDTTTVYCAVGYTCKVGVHTNCLTLVPARIEINSIFGGYRVG